jgi:hypothetical protein
MDFNYLCFGQLCRDCSVCGRNVGSPTSIILLGEFEWSVHGICSLCTMSGVDAIDAIVEEECDAKIRNNSQERIIAHNYYYQENVLCSNK